MKFENKYFIMNNYLNFKKYLIEGKIKKKKKLTKQK